MYEGNANFSPTANVRPWCDGNSSDYYDTVRAWMESPERSPVLKDVFVALLAAVAPLVFDNDDDLDASDGYDGSSDDQCRAGNSGESSSDVSSGGRWPPPADPAVVVGVDSADSSAQEQDGHVDPRVKYALEPAQQVSASTRGRRTSGEDAILKGSLGLGDDRHRLPSGRGPLLQGSERPRLSLGHPRHVDKRGAMYGGEVDEDSSLCIKTLKARLANDAIDFEVIDCSGGPMLTDYVARKDAAIQRKKQTTLGEQRKEKKPPPKPYVDLVGKADVRDYATVRLSVAFIPSDSLVYLRDVLPHSGLLEWDTTHKASVYVVARVFFFFLMRWPARSQPGRLV